VRAGIIKDARLVAGCMHRFCSQCIEKWLRMTKRAPRAPGPPACPPAAPLASLPGSLGALCCAARLRLAGACPPLGAGRRCMQRQLSCSPSARPDARTVQNAMGTYCATAE